MAVIMVYLSYWLSLIVSSMQVVGVILVVAMLIGLWHYWANTHPILDKMLLNSNAKCLHSKFTWCDSQLSL